MDKSVLHAKFPDTLEGGRHLWWAPPPPTLWQPSRWVEQCLLKHFLLILHHMQLHPLTMFFNLLKYWKLHHTFHCVGYDLLQPSQWISISISPLWLMSCFGWCHDWTENLDSRSYTSCQATSVLTLSWSVITDDMSKWPSDWSFLRTFSHDLVIWLWG